MNEIIEITEVPGLLRHIPDPPKILYAQGDTTLLDRKDCLFVCVVGPRKSSAYGQEVTRLVIEHLSKFNVITVSGAAYGVDGLVHTLSIQHNIPTIAIPGSGIDDESFYPKAHIDLKYEILNNNGLIMSEFHPMAKASKWTFPIRNRIMAGISHLVIIIEAERKSGTLITAHLAVDYNRDVLVVPGSIFSTTSQGTLELATKGAELFLGVESLTAALCRLADNYSIDIFKSQLTSSIETTFTAEQDNFSILDSLSPDEVAVYRCIRSNVDGIEKEKIACKLDMSISLVSICITLLELHELIKINIGKAQVISTITTV